MSSNVTIAVDIAKNVFEIAISAAAGRIQERRRMTRQQCERFWSTREPCRVVMEGCSGSHYWARLLIGLGFEVMLIPPYYLTPYRRRNKTDRERLRRWAETEHERSAPLVYRV